MGDNKLVLRLDAWLRENRPDYHATLNPGIGAAELVAWERSLEQKYHKDLGLSPADWLRKLPQTFRDLYLWRNGHPSEEQALHRNLRYLPLREVLTWQPVAGALAFLWSDTRRMLALDLLGKVKGPKASIAGQVFSADADTVQGAVDAPNFDSWLEAFVTTLEAGHWEVEDDDGLVTLSARDYDEYKAAWNQVCPGHPGEDVDLRALWT